MNISFDYEYNGEDVFGKIYRPVAKVKFFSPVVNKQVEVWMIVDTGADHSILPRHLSEKLRISLEKDCIKEFTFGIGGSKNIYFCKKKIKVKLGNAERKVPIAFLDSNEVPALLGRLGFLETFDTQFLKSRKVVFRE